MSKQGASQIVSVGDVLAGKYRVEKILGMGGMGVVVAATHLDLREIRAIKLMRPDAASEQSVERFLREARAVVRLRSEHVAEVFDVGRLESGAPYIVMEMLEGEDLAALQRRAGPLPIEEAVLYVAQACHALSEAHAAGIVHRDLKPGNLFLTRRLDGSTCVKVLDFGISKHTRPAGQSVDPEMTGARDLMGSPLYMAPEQMRSARKVDARADVWSLGAILYKLLTGKAPFQAPTVPEIFAAALAIPARLPSSLRPEIPRGLDTLILRCLEKPPTRRFGTANELLAALRPFGPWGPADDAEDGPTVLFTQSRRSTMPPARRTPAPAPIELDDDDLLPSSSVAPVSRTNRPGLRSTPAAEDAAGTSVSPWGSRPRNEPKPTPLALISALAALATLAGVGVAAFLVHWPALPAVFVQKNEPHTARGSGAAASPAANEASEPPLHLPPSAISTAVPAALPPGSAIAAPDTRPPASEGYRTPCQGADMPTAKGVVPVRGSQGSTSTVTFPAKPPRTQYRGKDPFQGRH